MAAASTSWALLLLLIAATGEATTISITNQCSDTVWPAAVPIGGGMRLDPGKSWTLEVPASVTSSGQRIWPRTGCLFDDKGNGSCQTGDCGGLLACKSNGKPPNTLAEFTGGQLGGKDYFSISLVDGFNVPMDFVPVPIQGGPGCSKGPRCTSNITLQCPSQLQAPGGCNNPCKVFKQDRYCCAGNSASCEPTTYSLLFARMCPEAYNYSRDDSSSTVFTCPTGTNYHIVFCPLVDASSVARSSGLDLSVWQYAVLGFVFIAFITAIILFIMLIRRTRRRKEMEDEEDDFRNLQGTPMRFTFQQLEVATLQFRDKLGEGGFGSVFKGQLGEETVAVKRLDRTGHGKGEFLAEKSHRLLVYEYVPRGSLDKWIYCQQDNNASPLEWRLRCKIITDIAKGLSYLHEECMKRIVHLDVKPQNILLDENFSAKLSDFGLCKLIDRDMSQVVTRMRGTPGYLAPEWLTSHITEKADVYSFGVVVMEIVSGRKNLDTSRTDESLHLITLLEEKVKSDKLVDLIDKNSNDMRAHEQEVIQMMKLAMWCLQIDCKRRPQMSEIIKVLEGTKNAETSIENNFVSTSPLNFSIAGNLNSSAPLLASDLSGPR
ncbi:PR5-like receptor kinase [Lolium rigidum]|uniref:PR5-like receptor kinase n=1 Tax=Lolium rigidum TaxID=89674 RepID=UPI001F5E3541|nr:PR5-like receptor kinase [Lolium rigidum]